MSFVLFTFLFALIVVGIVFVKRRGSGFQGALPLRRLGMIGAALFLLLMLSNTIVVVRAGHVGVVDVFGRVANTR